MISLLSHTKIRIAAGVTDLRRGFTGLSALVQTQLEQNPLPGHVFIFRGRRGDLVKLIWFDGDGLVHAVLKKIEKKYSTAPALSAMFQQVFPRYVLHSFLRNPTVLPRAEPREAK